MSQKDSGYNQKAIDSLINFETVKYFNAEDHERNRFEKSLVDYKESQILLSNTVRVQSFVLSTITNGCLTTCLILAYKRILSGEFTVGDFVVFQMYLQQL